ncbi:Beta-1,2-xylosyltransferase 1 [Cyphellophora attinorum]|uniref:Beta-1,2-xylosyltransferase 1 n=1 Tax=Cyphellophora attinorum TaxID=1664694 RepID=A0A0N1NXY6_9EURO|nr:Beta-1,2-xylosyltransferase 1 [Phialophora attinorum]KPI36267.1 Beta-1,2-xylosyltransferase 1 [Phialophora attinorum]
MGRFDLICAWLSPACLLWLAYSTDHAIAYHRPVHTAVLSLAVCSCCLVYASRAFPTLLSKPSQNGASPSLLPHVKEDSDEKRGVPPSATQETLNGTRRPILLVLAVIALSCRIETLRRITKSPECTVPSVEVWLPLLLAIYDGLRFQRSTPQDATAISNLLMRATRLWGRRSRFRYILPVASVCLGCQLLLTSWWGLNSTFICPIVTGEQLTVPASQLSGLFMDAVISAVIWEQLPRGRPNNTTAVETAHFLSRAMVGVVVAWIGIGTAVYGLAHRHRYYVLLLDASSVSMWASIVIQAIVFSVLVVTSLHCTVFFGPIETSMKFVVLITGQLALPFLWTSTDAFPPVPKAAPICGVLVLCSGWMSFRRVQWFIDQPTLGRSFDRLLALFAALVVLLVMLKSSAISVHPIDSLIEAGNLQHEAYVNVSLQQRTLRDAVVQYQQRYHRSPPPGFDLWYKFATNKKCLIIDEYDQINEDLLPFFDLTPAQIRQSTWEIASNQWNEAAGISIRNGTARVQDNVIPTHRWMVEGVEALINSFAAFLPDMDLVFNINDEPRVALSHEKLEQMRSSGAQKALSGRLSWSENRTAEWLPEAVEQETRNFEVVSRKDSFRDWGVIGCPPSSVSRRDRALIGSKASLCTSCVAPHSLGQFVSNWSLAADMCHQPDMAHLHGFYTSPAAFKPAGMLMPVFSQSKAHGYNDILYPSAWNYMDKVKYDPSMKEQGKPGEDNYKPAYPDVPFRQKKNAVFWRGATSEGISGGDGEWRGMVRQRLVHLANNATSHPHDEAMILLPHPQSENQWEYVRVPGDLVPNLGLETDIHIVNNIARCGGEGLFDCTDQEAEFAPTSGTDFQAHWAYKYLFDLDGAGFSGRFLPFLQSRSLPFKSALFREWYDSRLTAWKHFVPQDIRLHSFWSTLAYFAGVDGTLPDGRSIKWAGREKQAEAIALEGRAWANKVLRKEDMEVYFFRLLLEWGRITDDNREELGFVVP